MSIFSHFRRPRGAPGTAAKRLAAGALHRAEVVAGFELLLGRAPASEFEIEEILRLPNIQQMVEHLIRSAEFRMRYKLVSQIEPAWANGRSGVERPASIFLGDRILCWTHRGQRIYVVPQDVDLTPRILLNGTWEVHVEETMLRFVRPGDTVIDLGANVGYYTIILCAAVAPEGMVYAFEAHPDLMRLLKATMYVNGLDHLIELCCCAVSDQAGTLTLALSQDHYGSGNVVPGDFIPTYDDNYPNRLEVPAMTLDATLADRVHTVDLIHMDIEGSEPAALRGAQKLIERSPGIRIITEWSVPMMAVRADLGAYVSWLAGLGFHFWWIDRETAELVPVERTALLDLPHCDLLLSRSDPG